jgi:Flp pilus assembly pilin Flp
MLALTVLSHLKNCFLNEEAQDLVEYALIVALLSFCAISSMTNLATGIASAYTHLAAAFNGDLGF